MLEQIKHVCWVLWHALNGRRLQLVPLEQPEVGISINIEPVPDQPVQVSVSHAVQEVLPPSVTQAGHPADPARFRVTVDGVETYTGASGAQARDVYFGAQLTASQTVTLADHGEIRGAWQHGG